MAAQYEERLRRVIDYIHDNAAGDLSLDTLADVAAMSRFHWHRVFRAMTGETCAQAVRRIRLHKAAFLLTDAPHLSIDEIAAVCGLGGRAAFTRAFSEAYGLSPARFRADGKAAPLFFATSQKAIGMYDISIESTPGHRVLAIAHQGEYTQISRAFEQLNATVTSRGLWGDVTGMVGIYYDDPSATAPEDLRSHAGVCVGEATEAPDPLKELSLPAGRVARLRLRGPYTGLPAAYEHLYGVWLPQTGEEPSDAAPYEMYLNSPMDTAPADLLTDICVLLAD